MTHPLTWILLSLCSIIKIVLFYLTFHFKINELRIMKYDEVKAIELSVIKILIAKYFIGNKESTFMKLISVYERTFLAFFR